VKKAGVEGKKSQEIWGMGGGDDVGKSENSTNPRGEERVENRCHQGRKVAKKKNIALVWGQGLKRELDRKKKKG